MNPEIVQTQSWRYKTIVVIKRQQQTTLSNYPHGVKLLDAGFTVIWVFASGPPKVARGSSSAKFCPPCLKPHVTPLSSRHHCWNQQRARGSAHRLNSCAGLVQLEEQQKSDISFALQLHIFCFHQSWSNNGISR